jgi:hypothetical protein
MRHSAAGLRLASASAAAPGTRPTTTRSWVRDLPVARTPWDLGRGGVMDCSSLADLHSGNAGGAASPL